MSMELAFNDVQFDVIPRDGQPWVTSRQLAQALGYKDENSVRKIYERNKGEFSSMMTATVNMTVGLTEVIVRIFSMRGCHLVGMFARTPVAKAFRRWVLDVIEQYGDRVPVASPVKLNDATRPSRRSDPERKALTAIISTWVGMAPIHYASARSQVNAHFGVASVDALTIGQVRDAIQWVQEKIDALQKTLPQAALPSPCAAHPVIDEKPFLDFIEEIQAAHEEVDRILSRLHHSVFTLSWKVAEALEQRADIRLYLVPDMLSENTLRGYLHQSVYHDVRKALTAPGRQLEQYSNPGYSLLGIVRQLNGNGRA